MQIYEKYSKYRVAQYRVTQFKDVLLICSIKRVEK